MVWYGMVWYGMVYGIHEVENMGVGQVLQKRAKTLSQRVVFTECRLRDTRSISITHRNIVRTIQIKSQKAAYTECRLRVLRSSPSILMVPFVGS